MNLDGLLRFGKKTGRKVLATALTPILAASMISCGNSDSENKPVSEPTPVVEGLSPNISDYTQFDALTVEAGSVGKCVEFDAGEGNVVCLMDAPQAPAEFETGNFKVQKVYSAPMLPKSAENAEEYFANECLEVHDQGILPTCVSESTTLALEAMLCEELGDFNSIKRLSEPHLLFNGKGNKTLEQALSGGWYVSAAFNSLMNQLIVPFSVWEYSKNVKNVIDSQPSDEELVYEAKWGTMDFFYVPGYNVDALKSALSDDANVVLTVPVYKNAKWNANNGNDVGVIENVDGEIIGFHSVLVTGYDDDLQRFTFRNSWGKFWGKKGAGSFSFDFIANNDCRGFYALTPRGCMDDDNDGHAYDASGECVQSDDSCDNDLNNYTETGCDSCVDGDLDGYGESCDLGGDCDDSDGGKWEFASLAKKGFYTLGTNVCEVVETCEPACEEGYSCDLESLVCLENVVVGCDVTGCDSGYTCNLETLLCDANVVETCEPDCGEGYFCNVDYVCEINPTGDDDDDTVSGCDVTGCDDGYICNDVTNDCDVDPFYLTGSWMNLVSPTTENLTGIKKIGNSYFAWGENGTLIHSLNGNYWHKETYLTTTANINDVCGDENRLFIIPNVFDTMYTSNGTTLENFVNLTVRNEQWLSCDGNAETGIWFGATDDLIARVTSSNPNAMEEMNTYSIFTDISYRKVEVNSANDVWVFGKSTYLYNSQNGGEDWDESYVSSELEDLEGSFATGRINGYPGNGAIFEYDGNNWNKKTIPTSYWVHGISEDSQGRIWAVGGKQDETDGTILYLHGDNFEEISNPSGNALYSVEGEIAVGKDGTIIRYVE